MSRPDLAVILEQFFREHSEGVISAYLFGSHATGRDHRESDVDVAVLFDRIALPTPAERFKRRVLLLSGLIAALHKNAVDLIVLNDVPSQLARAALAGRRVFCADTEADHVFLRTTLILAADLEPFLRSTRRVKLNAIAR